MCGRGQVALLTFRITPSDCSLECLVVVRDFALFRWFCDLRIAIVDPYCGFFASSPLLWRLEAFVQGVGIQSRVGILKDAWYPPIFLWGWRISIAPMPVFVSCGAPS